MKTRDFNGSMRISEPKMLLARTGGGGPRIGSALLGIACAVGVLGMLTLLYHFG